VAGVEVHYADVTPVKIDGMPARVQDLAVGQVVAVVASGTGDSLQAVSVDVVHAVTGPVAEVDASGAVVAGRRFALGARDLALAAQARAQGAALKVSALPGPDGSLQVTRLDLAPGDEPARLTGVVTRVGPDQVEVDGQRVSLSRALARSLRVDQQVALSGRWRDGRLRVETVAEAPTQTVLTRAARAVVEGFVSDGSAARVRAGGREFRLPSDNASRSDRVRELRRGERVVVTAESDGKRWRVLRVDVTRARDERERESGRSPIDADPGDGPPSGPREGRGGETDRKGDPARERRKESVLADSPVTRRDGDDLEEIARTRESGRAEKPGDAEKAAGRVGIDRTDRPEAAPRPERLERPERIERLERPERIERLERLERPERPERLER
jgi:hypothetical protein